VLLRGEKGHNIPVKVVHTRRHLKCPEVVRHVLSSRGLGAVTRLHLAGFEGVEQPLSAAHTIKRRKRNGGVGVGVGGVEVVVLYNITTWLMKRNEDGPYL
jgi:hypothetical protein